MGKDISHVYYKESSNPMKRYRPNHQRHASIDANKEYDSSSKIKIGNNNSLVINSVTKHGSTNKISKSAQKWYYDH